VVDAVAEFVDRVVRAVPLPIERLALRLDEEVSIQRTTKSLETALTNLLAINSDSLDSSDV